MLHLNCRAPDGKQQDKEDTFTIFEIQSWLPDFIIGLNRFKKLTAWPVWKEVTCHIENKTKLSSLSIDSQLKF